MGPPDGRPGPSRDRLAVPPLGAHLRAAARRRARAPGARPHRPGPGRLLLRHEDRVAPGVPARPPRARGPGRARVRHRGQLAPLAAHRRARSRHRSLERLADPLLRHPPARLGCGADRPPRDPARGVPPDRPVGRRVRGDGRPRRASGGHPGGGHRRGPAGGAVRPGRGQSRRREEHVRDGVLSPPEHGPGAGRVGGRPPLDRRVVAPVARRRPAERVLRARGCRVRGRRRGPVAPGRARPHRLRGRERVAGARGAGHGRRLPGARLRGPGRALLGHVRAGRPRGAHPRDHARPCRARDAGSDRLSDP